MCTTCGCSDEARITITDLHDEAATRVSEVKNDRQIQLESDVLAKNNRLAEQNRGWFARRGVVALNLLGSPGAGKTTLLERTIRELTGDVSIQVIEGDQATINDARRIESTGCRVIQINTGAGCHLEADMIAQAIEKLDPGEGSMIVIENVGNMVCPALFDLGEHGKVVVASVTEGEDKPIKYPHLFREASLVLLNKIDLLEHVSFDSDRFRDYVSQVNPNVDIIPVSATFGTGLDAWIGWLRKQIESEIALGV